MARVVVTDKYQRLTLYVHEHTWLLLSWMKITQSYLVCNTVSTDFLLFGGGVFFIIECTQEKIDDMTAAESL